MGFQVLAIRSVQSLVGLVWSVWGMAARILWVSVPMILHGSVFSFFCCLVGDRVAFAFCRWVVFVPVIVRRFVSAFFVYLAFSSVIIINMCVGTAVNVMVLQMIG